MIEKYEKENERLSKDLPILKEVMEATFKKEPELKDLKSQLDSLNRQINLSLENNKEKDVDVTQVSQEQQPTVVINPNAYKEEKNYPRVGGPLSVGQIMSAMGERLVIAKVDSGDNQTAEPRVAEARHPVRGIKL